MTNLKDDPSDIANYLIQENGLDRSIQAVSNGIMKSQKDGDNYALSVWREVGAILKKKTGPEGPAS